VALSPTMPERETDPSRVGAREIQRALRRLQDRGLLRGERSLSGSSGERTICPRP